MAKRWYTLKTEEGIQVLRPLAGRCRQWSHGLAGSGNIIGIENLNNKIITVTEGLNI